MSAATTRKGILAGGNWIVDQVKMVDTYPQRETLANISTQSEGTGGSPYNILINLAKLGAKIPLAGAGMVGKDGFGDYILKDLKRHKVDAANLMVFHGFHMVRVIAKGQKTTMDFGVQGFHPAVHHFRETGIVGNLYYRHTPLTQKFGGPSSREDFNPGAMQFFSKLKDTCLIRNTN